MTTEEAIQELQRARFAARRGNAAGDLFAKALDVALLRLSGPPASNVVQVPDVDAPNGWCFLQAPTMERCTYPKGHAGPHQWDRTAGLPRHEPHEDAGALAAAPTIPDVAERLLASVWIVESGDYEQRGVCGPVYRSVEAAVAGIKAGYGSPYIVRWEELKQEREGEYSLTGYFDAVLHYSIQHTGRYDITRYKLVGCAPVSSDAEHVEDSRAPAP